MPHVVNTGTASYFYDDDIHLTFMMTMLIRTKTTASLTTVIMFLVLLGLLLKVFIRYFGIVKSDNRLSTGFKLERV